MSTFIIVVKIKDYFPKIDYIPFYNYACIISCKNVFARIKLINKDIDLFESKVYVIDKCDMLFKIRLIDEMKHNFLIGVYNLIIPFQKLVQMIKTGSTLYQRQIKLNMNPKIRINSIYLDLLIEIFFDKKIQKTLYQNYLNKGISYNKNANKNSNNYYSDSDYNKKIYYLRSQENQNLITITNNDKENKNIIPYMNNRVKGESNNRNINNNYNRKNYNNNISYYESPINNYHQNRNIKNDIEKCDLNRKHFLEKSSFYKRLFNNTNNILNTSPNHMTKNYSTNNLLKNNKSAIKYNNSLLRSPFNYSGYADGTPNKKYKIYPRIKKSNNNNLLIFWNYPNNTKIIKQNTPNKFNYIIKYTNNYLPSNHVKHFSTEGHYFNAKRPKQYKSNNLILNNTKTNNFKTNNTNIIINNINMTNRSCSKLEIQKRKQSPKMNRYFSKKCISINQISRNGIQNVKYNIKKANNIPSSNDIKEFYLTENNKNNNNNINNELITDTKRNIISVANTQEELLNNIFKLIETNFLIISKIKKIKTNKKILVNKNLFYKEKYYELYKINNKLINKQNNVDIFLTHVSDRGKFNEKVLFNISKNKKKEFTIFDYIFGEKADVCKKLAAKRKIDKKLNEQKQIHALLNIIRDLIKNYGNLSCIYNSDKNKQILFKSLLLRYCIRENEEDNKTILEKYQEKIKKNEQQNKEIIKKEMIQQVFKSIKEEDEEGDEQSSLKNSIGRISVSQSKRNSLQVNSLIGSLKSKESEDVEKSIE